MALPRIIETTVHKTGDETVEGKKTFSSTIDGSITGTSATLQSDIDAAYAALEAEYKAISGTTEETSS